jgi:hypothetical protein
MSHRPSIPFAGWSLIVGAIAFMAVFSYLAARFHYPEVLDGNADAVLPQLLATGTTGRAVWTLYAFLPLIWIPAGVGACVALKDSHPGAVLLALQCAVVAALAMMLGLMRWPTIHWHLATLYATADVAQREVIGALFDGLNVYLGNFIGEFLGELAFSLFFVLTSWALLRARVVHIALPVLGLATGACGLIGMFRNVTALVAPLAAINNYLLPLWMIVFGVVLVRWRSSDAVARR